MSLWALSDRLRRRRLRSLPSGTSSRPVPTRQAPGEADSAAVGPERQMRNRGRHPDEEAPPALFDDPYLNRSLMTGSLGPVRKRG